MWRHAPGVLWRRSGSLRVLLCPGTNETFVIEASGSTTWDLLAQPVEEEEVFRQIGRIFEIDPAAVRSDVTSFLKELRAVGAVTST
jgi:hypothetical protein